MIQPDKKQAGPKWLIDEECSEDGKTLHLDLQFLITSKFSRQIPLSRQWKSECIISHKWKLKTFETKVKDIEVQDVDQRTCCQYIAVSLLGDERKGPMIDTKTS